MIYPKPTTKYHTGSHSICLSRTGERTRRVKLRKHLSWDKDRLKGKAKTIHTSEAKEGIKSVLPMAGRSSGEQGPMMHNAYLRWQTPSLQASPASFLPLCLHSFTCYVWAIWSGVFLWSVVVSYPGCVPSQTGYWWVGWEAENQPCVSPAQQ